MHVIWLAVFDAGVTFQFGKKLNKQMTAVKTPIEQMVHHDFGTNEQTGYDCDSTSNGPKSETINKEPREKRAD